VNLALPIALNAALTTGAERRQAHCGGETNRFDGPDAGREVARRQPRIGTGAVVAERAIRERRFCVAHRRC